MSTTTTLEVLFAPAEFATLPSRDLSATVCVVFDILRATSTMVTALGNGAAAIIPVGEIPEALEVRRQNADVLLAGEREGLRIEAALTGGLTFDLGNSPQEFLPETVRGKTIVMTTTNGTRALRACAGANQVLLGSFLNLAATARFLERTQPAHLLLVCSGTFDQSAYEDVLGVGALCDLLWQQYSSGKISDSALMACSLFKLEQNDLGGAFGKSRNGSRLMAQPRLCGDVACCAQRDTVDLVAMLGKDGRVTGETNARESSTR